MRPAPAAAAMTLLAVALAPRPAISGSVSDVYLYEDFRNLDRWEPLKFPKIDRLSTYTAEETKEGGFRLRAESRNSASGLVLREEFDVGAYPLLRWRWRTDSVYRKGDARTKDGDDYPLRLYVLFPYDPGRSTFREKLLFEAARLVHDRYPPHSALNYIWASRELPTEVIANAFTERAVMIVKRGPGDIGAWHDDEADIVADYRRAFGRDPPPRARLAVMNDSDNTGESSVSFIDFIEIRR